MDLVGCGLPRDSGGSWLSAEGRWRRQQVPSQSLCLQSHQCWLPCLHASLRPPSLKTLDDVGPVEIVQDNLSASLKILK